MKDKSLRALMVDDSENDVLLIIRELKKGGYNPIYERVETSAAMKKALQEKQWDIILCDYKMPKFNAPSAIAVLKEASIDIPLIVVSGTVGEDVAVECLRIGAQDYIMKDKMIRLCLAIARELEDAKVRKKQKHTEKKLRNEEQRFKALAEHSLDIIVLLNKEGIVTYVNPAVERILGFKPEEGIGSKTLGIVHPDDLKNVADKLKTLATNTNSPVLQTEMRLRHKDGSWRIFETVGSNLVNDNVIETIIINQRDITERKKVEEKLKKSEAKYRNIFENAMEGIYQSTNAGQFITVNAAFARMAGYDSPKELIDSIKDIGLQLYVHPEERKRFLKIREEEGFVEGFEVEFYKKNGSTFWVVINARAVTDEQGKIIYTEGLIEDITLRKHAEEKLHQSIEVLKKAVGTTIQVLVSALEVRDPYTSGHQSRSANLACNIAKEMGLVQEKIEGIRMASIIHDIGKLSVPVEILIKPTKLTNLEFSLIKEHSRSGYEMLKDVESPWPLAEIVHQHHERMNGTGYPRNLKGDEILMESRILAVADVVEAMASNRPYRSALGIKVALEEIEKNKGILYDDVAADACLILFREKGYQFT